MKTKTYSPKRCLHCDALYTPLAANQKWCRVCCPDGPSECRLRLYGLSHPEFVSLWEDTGGRCCLCQRQLEVSGMGKLAVDHCHVSGKVRGLLCIKCNCALHHVENKGWLRGAQSYLRKRA